MHLVRAGFKVLLNLGILPYVMLHSPSMPFNVLIHKVGPVRDMEHCSVIQFNGDGTRADLSVLAILRVN